MQQEKVRLTAATLAEDVDVFGQLCRQEVSRQVERWLRTPVGQETVELEKRRAAERAARQDAAAAAGRGTSPKWSQKPLPAAAAGGL